MPAGARAATKYGVRHLFYPRTYTKATRRLGEEMIKTAPQMKVGQRAMRSTGGFMTRHPAYSLYGATAAAYGSVAWPMRHMYGSSNGRQSGAPAAPYSSARAGLSARSLGGYA